MARDLIDPTRIGEEFQERTKYRPDASDHGARWEAAPPYKSYSSPLLTIRLPRPELSGGPRLWDTMRARRSARSYGSRPIHLQELSQLLWAAQGVTAEQHGYRFRAAPSAGALYPIETYAAAHNVHSLEMGLYHYSVPDHSLTQLRRGDLRAELTTAAIRQKMCAIAGLVFIWTAVIGRSAQKYAQRAYRYIYLDAGHIAQNVALACTALGLGSCPIAALFDDEVNAILEVDGYGEIVLYMTSVGPVS